MAIISIPSSIGGVAIPGGLLAVGPLAALFGNKGIATHQYPRDLGSATRGHYVEFYINEVKEFQLTETVNKVRAGIEKAVTNSTEFVNNAKVDINKEEEPKETNVENTKKTETKAVIALYMPETMAFTYNTPYDETSLLEVAQEAASLAASGLKGIPFAGKVAEKGSKLLTSVPKSGAVRLLGKSLGLAINPQKQLLFQGIGFRDYQLVFTFTPYSKAESQQIADIIKQFKMAAAPQITTSAGGMFFKVPKTFKIKFMFNNKENTKISKVTDSVLTTVDVNYSPNTWAAMDDGAPAQVMLTLNFKEINLVDRTMIKDGY